MFTTEVTNNPPLEVRWEDKVVFIRFSSLRDVLSYKATSYFSMGTSWTYGTDNSRKGMIERLNRVQPLPEAEQGYRKWKESVYEFIPNLPLRRRRVDREIGNTIIADRVLSGSLDRAWWKSEKSKLTPVVKIFIPLDLNSKGTQYNFGRMIGSCVAAIEDLENKGWRVEVDGIASCEEGSAKYDAPLKGRNLVITLPLKASQDPLDKFFLLSLGCPGIFRGSILQAEAMAMKTSLSIIGACCSRTDFLDQQEQILEEINYPGISCIADSKGRLHWRNLPANLGKE